jgi:hypothetical protein
MWRHISVGSDRKNYFLPVFERLDSFPHFHLQKEWKRPQVLKCYVDYGTINDGQNTETE